VITSTAVDLVADLERVAAGGGERERQDGIGAAVGARGTDDPPIGGGDRDDRSGS
jgi:hypothetical protein